MQIDHVVLAVADLDDAADRFTARTGLASVPGGRHPGWGTANRIVPLGPDYIELLAVEDAEVGAGTILGRTLLALTRDGRDRWFSVCLADAEIQSTANRLGLIVETGSRTRPDGVEVRWRGAGIDEPSRPAWLPFFIDWELPEGEHPGRTPVEHRVLPLGISGVEMAGDPAVMDRWLDGADVPLSVTDDGGAFGIRTVTVGIDGGPPIVIDDGPAS